VKIEKFKREPIWIEWYPSYSWGNERFEGPINFEDILFAQLDDDIRKFLWKLEKSA